MKKFFGFFVLIIFSFLSISFFNCSSVPAKIKTDNVVLDDSLKFDSTITQGQLSNGMTYFIKKNSEPQNRIFLRLIVKAGSVMEEENERGVAHFIEHLAFNGTEHFQKTQIVDWFEKIGMNFGGDLNAFTSFEETVYMLEIPADDPEILKTAILILHDWASAVTFPQEEIDKERGVIQEEWRLRDLGLNGRKTNKLIPFVMKDSVFENRMPIGKMEVIDKITRDEILNFYRKWYKPEIMSVVVVGEIDVEKVEEEIKNTMGKIPASENPININLNRIPKNNKKEILVITDSEQKYPIFQIMEQQEKVAAIFTKNDLYEDLKFIIASNIFNIRANEISNTINSKWLAAQLVSSTYNDSDKFMMMAAVPKEGFFVDTMKALFDEYDRIVTYGITDAELQIIKNGLTADLNNYLANKEKISSENVISNIQGYYLTGEIFQSPDDYYKNYMELINLVSVEDINEYLKKIFTERGTKLVVLAPEGYDDLPTENEMMEIWTNYKNEEIAVYEDDAIEKLMERPTKKSKVKSKSRNSELDTVEYVLQNGIKIITKKTDFVKDTIIMSAISKGGSVYVSDEDFPSFNVAVDYALLSGFNGFTNNQVSKFLADKAVSFVPEINFTSERITGNATNKDLEYLLQCINLMFSARQYTEDAWQLELESTIIFAKNHGSTPQDVFLDKINEIVYGKNDLRHAPFDMKAFEKLNSESAKKIVEERFSNPADFTFVFAGDFDEKNLINLCQFYLGTLQTTDEREETKYLYWDFPKGKNVETVKKGIDEQGRVLIAFGGSLLPEEDIEKNYNDKIIMNQLASLLDIRLREVIREDNSGSYGIGVSGMIDGYPEQYYIFEVGFGCEPKRCEELTSAVLNTIKEIQENGVSDDNIQKLCEAYRRNHEINLRDNWWWIGKINAISVLTYQPSWVVKDTEKICNWITSEALQEAAKKYLDTENYMAVFLQPE